MPSRLPAPAPHVFKVQCEAIIAAPVADVWAALLDFSKYGEWNPFVRSMHLVDASGADVEPGTLPAAGHKLVLRTNLPPKLAGEGTRAVHCDISHFDHDSYRARWENREYPSWFLRTDRWSVLTEEELEDGSKRTVYESQETFHGLGAYLVKWFAGADVQRGFDAMAQSLKTRLEGPAPA
ncbi:hypothetical protein AURDEDRAFT_112963 [Auricularia subglabra TFB-10046 SS5]|nr:hypothetical protein AURDEDRAFT_112963 [Auricularia subglabra TFB-10046 SS5]